MKEPQHTPELLAPAGSPDAGYAALAFGADAIYLGLTRFSARADADNFTIDQLDEITAFAHSMTPPRRVYCAVNTVLLDREIDDLIEALARIEHVGVDAVIVQDLGVYRLVKRSFPGLRLHASTQMAIHHRHGVETLRDLGFQRVTLARELTLEEIRTIASTPGIETEVFAYGALCYSYSGLCLFSGMVNGHSGNRGQCKYLCREAFLDPSSGSGGFLFSMKDLALGDWVGPLAQAGVSALKIEGRKKGPLYVAAATHLYRRLLDGDVFPSDREVLEQDLRSVFSRPWTSLYVPGRHTRDSVDPERVGHRGTAAGRVLAVVSRAGRHRIRVKASRAMERYDGLQLEWPGLDQPYGFSAERMFELPGEREVFQVRAGATVEIELPGHHRQVPVGAEVFCASSQAVKRKYRFDRPRGGDFRRRWPLEVEVVFELMVLKARGRIRAHSGIEVRACVQGPLGPAKNLDRIEADVRRAFDRLGDTRLSLAGLTVVNPHGLFASSSLLNALRRDLASRAESELDRWVGARIHAVRAEARQARPGRALVPHDPQWLIKVDRVAYLQALGVQDRAWVHEITLDIGLESGPDLVAGLDDLGRAWGRERIRLAVPVVVRAWEAHATRAKIQALLSAGYTRWEASNLAALGWVKGPGIDWTADWPLYVLNSSAASGIADLGFSRFTLSPEDNLANMADVLSHWSDLATAVVYQDTPLFISESCTCPQVVEGPCVGPQVCARPDQVMQGSDGRSYTLRRRGGRLVVARSEPYCLASRLHDLVAAGARWLRADFMWRRYDADEVASLWRAMRQGRPPAKYYEGPIGPWPGPGGAVQSPLGQTEAE